ncbi:aldo/keto reductase (plasmid) [Streptomyces sp. QH1-20]|uniref:aldo/keto reductase n=1 Tax=Streptomyces sp. QH1-20 TaxID=3240934 RepID=UPI0035149C07
MSTKPPLPPLASPPYRRSGVSGLCLSPLGLGLAPRFPARLSSTLVGHALDLGVTHFDLSCPSAGRHQAEEEIGTALAPWRTWREEMTLTVRVGLGTGPHPSAGYGSRRHILGSLDAFLSRTGQDYVDVLYLHRHDPNTPLEESARAMASAVNQGKALYVGLSSFPAAHVRQVASLLSALGTPAVAYQGTYSLLDRWAEVQVLDLLDELGIGFIACAPMAHGTLTRSRRPPQPRATDAVDALVTLTQIAASRQQPLEHLALAWCLRNPAVTSALLRTSSLEHLTANHHAAQYTAFYPAELAALDRCCPPDREDPSGHRPQAGLASGPGMTSVPCRL